MTRIRSAADPAAAAGRHPWPARVSFLLLLASAAGCGSAHHAESSAAPSDPPDLGAISAGNYVVTTPTDGAFALAAGGAAAPLVVDTNDFEGVVRVVGDLQADIKRVTGIQPTVSGAIPAGARSVVLIGTMGKSALIRSLVSSGKLDLSPLREGGKARWETFLIQQVAAPAEGVDRALVIVGSDQRGTIYGAYDVSRRIGVSPWYWWDDVKPAHQDALYVKAGRFSQGTPAVKYRGFFINDENPQTGRWAIRKFGAGLAVIPKPSCTDAGDCTSHDVAYTSGLNHLYWEKVFEVALRLRANYFWPAVWSSQFGDDDPLNLPTVKKYGIVFGTSHEAPMLRGINEWNNRVDPSTRNADGSFKHRGTDPWGGTGEWSFVRNADSLEAYWREGAQRMKDVGFDGVVTMAMRGTNDFPVDDFAAGKQVMANVLDAQKQILNDVFGEEKAAQLPKVWLLYKEVQTYWDTAQGALRPPPDVTVVWCDDNWGNMRKLQAADEPNRPGGYGIYYHFDYVGAGRNYKWADTNLLPNIWEQLNLVYNYDVRQLWLVNVGDMKGEEMPLQFFLDYAWNPNALTSDKIAEWERGYAAENFGGDRADAVADLLHRYELLQSDRKPELTNRRIWLDGTGAVQRSDLAYFASTVGGDPTTRIYYDDNPFSLTHYQELERVVEQWQELAARAEQVKATLPARKQDGFFELVNYQIQASANLYALRLAQFRNILYSAQGRVSALDWAAIAEARMADDKALSDHYNLELAGGKWDGWQTQPKIGYGDQDRYGGNAGWQQPELNNDAIDDAFFPLLRWTDFIVQPKQMGVTIDGAPMPFGSATPPESFWTTGTTPALPTFSVNQVQPDQYLEVFSRGQGQLPYTITAPAWLTMTRFPDVDTLDGLTPDVRATFHVNDWEAAADDVITVTGNGQTITVPVKVDKATASPGFHGFVEANGYVSIQAAHASAVVNKGELVWTSIPGIGRTGAGMKSFPIDAARQAPTAGSDSPRLEYRVFLTTDTDEVKVNVYVSPRNNFRRDTVLTKDSGGGWHAIAAQGDGLEYAVSIDDGPPQVVDINVGADDVYLNPVWERSTSDNVNLTTTAIPVSGAGEHTVKIWMVDPNVIVQKVVVDTETGELGESSLGPPESMRLGNAAP